MDHPDRVEALRREFDRLMPGLNQMHRIPDPVDAEQMLEVPPGPRSAAGLGQSLRVGCAAWNPGCAARAGWPSTACMECSATAEIARMQALAVAEPRGGAWTAWGGWTGACSTATCRTPSYRIQAEVGNEVFASGCFLAAADLLETQIVQPAPPSFLTPSAGDLLADAVLAEVN